MVTDDETPVAAGETGGQGDELAGGRAPPDADSPADLDAIVSGALTVLVRAEPQDLYLPELAPSDQERVDSFAKRGRAAATLQSYKSDWDLFIAWCLERRYRPLPASPATVAAFLSELATTGFAPAAEQRTKTGKLRAPRAPRKRGPVRGWSKTYAKRPGFAGGGAAA